MVQFLVSEGELKGLILSLDEGDQWVLGRDPEQCNLLLEDIEVDRVQLKCTHVNQTYIIENLSTARAVTVNGQILTQPHTLVPGDRIAIGRSVLVFSADPEIYEDIMFAKEEFEDSEESETEEVVREWISGKDGASEENNDLTESADAVSLPEHSEEQNVALEEESAHEHASVSDQESLKQDLETETSEDDSDDESLSEEMPTAHPPIPRFEPAEEFQIDLTPSSRFILKVIAGPNTGAEFAVDLGKEYLIGTDTTTCDIIFHDLSVSREHARLVVGKDGSLLVKDLGSRNGVVIDQKRVKEQATLSPNSVVTVGTTSFFFIDKEAPQETIVTPVLEPAAEPEEPQPALEEKTLDPTPEQEQPTEIPQAAKKPVGLAHFSGTLILSLFLLGFIALTAYGLFSLSQEKPAVAQPKTKDLALDVQEALKDFPGVRYTYNRTTRQLFLVGHVVSAVQNSELHYNLQALTFLRDVQNNVVNDEAIWQEMNLILSKNPEFKGVSMHASNPGVFVLSGYLKTEQQASDLMDYLNINFNYLDLLQNRVIVEEEVAEEITVQLFQNGFGAVNSVFLNGDLSLTGYIGAKEELAFKTLVEQLQAIPGIRHVQNYVVVVTVEQQVIDLTQRYPNRYTVTGYSRHGDVNINVVINGRILMRGDSIDGMTITSIQPHAIFLEKDGLQYKIEYNK